MAHARPSFTIGIEEEYWLVDRQTRDLVPDMPPGLVAACDKIAVGMVSPEFIRSQIEVGTPVGANIKETAEHLFALRRLVSDAVTNYGMAIISASTHPFAEWADQRHTDKERYNVLEQALQGVVRRLLICGMHVHVGIEDEDSRIDLMNQVLYFLPHLLALSTSSPYWHSADTGLKSYRTAVWRSLPRTGMPDEFDGWRDFERHAQVLIDAGVIEDATRLWWDIRPSVRYPTLEMRSTVATSLAVISALRSGTRQIAVPTRRRSVAAAAAASVQKGSKVRLYHSGRGPPPEKGVLISTGMMGCSGTNSDSNPSASAFLARVTMSMVSSVRKIVSPIFMV